MFFASPVDTRMDSKYQWQLRRRIGVSDASGAYSSSWVMEGITREDQLSELNLTSHHLKPSPDAEIHEDLGSLHAGCIV